MEKKIIRQVEYYFGDANLSRDRFLQSKIKEDEGGWVPLEIMIRFNRLKTLTEDFEEITAALAKSTSGLLEVSEDKLKIRRSSDKPIPNDTTEHRQEIRKKTIYCKGFKTDDTLDTIQKFLDEFGETSQIQMRRDKDRNFKGSIFATFDKEESAQKFLDTKDLKIGETEAVKMTRDDYFKIKQDERKQRREDEKKNKQEDREKREQEAIDAQQADFGEFEKGCVMHFTGASDQTSREDLKELFGQYGTISWVEFERGQTEGCVRFEEGTKASDVLEKAKAANDDKIIVRENELTVRVLEGEEEEKHWKQVYESKTKIRLRKKMGGGRGGGGRGRRGGRGGRGGGRGRDRDYGDRRARFEGKKTVFGDDDEGEAMEADVKKAEPASSSSATAPASSSDAAPTTTSTSEAVAAKADQSATPSAGGDASTNGKSSKVQVQEPESSESVKKSVKRPLEETSEAEPAQKTVKSSD